MSARTALVGVLVLLFSIAASAEEPRYHVLLTNDDGILSPGLAAVAEALAADPSYRVTVVAPAEQQSGKGTALTLRGDIEVRPSTAIAGWPAWSVMATPATTVQIALTVVLAEDPPDLVVSGINRGENIGRSAWYSGTVGAARESAFAGVGSIAFSLELDWDNPRPDFPGAARWVVPLVKGVRALGLPEGVCLNVNIPHDIPSIRGFRLARMGLAPPEIFGFDVVRESGRVKWYRGRWSPPVEDDMGTDIQLLGVGWIPIVPLGLDQTDYPSLAVLQDLVYTSRQESVAASASAAGEASGNR
jgi:5'-nucleotidase